VFTHNDSFTITQLLVFDHKSMTFPMLRYLERTSPHTNGFQRARRMNERSYRTVSPPAAAPAAGPSVNSSCANAHYLLVHVTMDSSETNSCVSDALFRLIAQCGMNRSVEPGKVHLSTSHG
jgi:hypothetical protein